MEGSSFGSGPGSKCSLAGWWKTAPARHEWSMARVVQTEAGYLSRFTKDFWGLQPRGTEAAGARKGKYLFPPGEYMAQRHHDQSSYVIGGTLHN